MSDIPNTEYITVNEYGVSVGGKPATIYRGQEIFSPDYVKKVFVWMQTQNSEITEFNVMSSVTHGEWAKPGMPSSRCGSNAWCRVKYRDGSVSAWVFNYTYTTAAVCAGDCVGDCIYDVRDNAGFRAAVFNKGMENQKKQDSKQPFVIKLLWHIVTIERRKKTM